MPSSYPTSLDNFLTNRTNTTVMVDSHPADHNNYADAINKIEAELGANTSRVVQSNRTQAGTTGAPTPTTVWTFQPVDTNKGPFRTVIGGAVFNGTWDTVMYTGYNVADGGGRVLSSEPSFRWVIEQDYEPTEGANHWVETYWEWVSADGTQQKRPFFGRYDRTTGNCLGFEFRAKGWTFADWGDAAQIVTITDRSGTIAILGHASQTVDSALTVTAQNSKQAFMLLSGTHGSFEVNSVATQQWAFRVAGSTPVQLGTVMAAFGAADLGQSATITAQTVTAQKDNFHTIKAKKIASQTTALLAIMSDTNTWYSRFNYNGYFMTQKSAAPADAELDTGELALWFDKTNSAAKLMIKAKQADGTVVTGSVALA